MRRSLLAVRPIYRILLHGICFEVVGREDGPDLVHRRVRMTAALHSGAAVRDQDLVDLALLPDEPLEVCERHHHRNL